MVAWWPTDSKCSAQFPQVNDRYLKTYLSAFETRVEKLKRDLKALSRGLQSFAVSGFPPGVKLNVYRAAQCSFMMTPVMFGNLDETVQDEPYNYGDSTRYAKKMELVLAY